MVQFAPRQNPYLPGGGFGAERPFSEATARVIDSEVRTIISDSHQQALRLLTAHRRELDALVEALLVHETLDEKEVLSVTGLPPAPALESGRISAALHKGALAKT